MARDLASCSGAFQVLRVACRHGPARDNAKRFVYDNDYHLVAFGSDLKLE
jgi:hypothetical protein